ncbi:MAG: biotin carboxylase N-terminal domain-containing protein [Acidimicrobiales bacterium]
MTGAAPPPAPLAIGRLLIANRGEIAVRIARTAHHMGIGTVGVYSEPDADALHCDVVDLAVALGGSSPAESYLRGDVIIAAALDTGCDAVHPGYGFLAENADFARAVTEAGLIWVGPTPGQIDLLGDKVAAKRAAAAAGVPTTAIHEVTSGAGLDDVALPALVKAAAGGGGRGMRVVRDRAELPEAVAAASREAAAAFGDGTVFIEPYVERGRHVEVQILGDAHGHVIHLGERECSIQRRNQKVVEESPSAGISSQVRASLFEGALALGRHVGYQGAGTVEFLVGDDGTVTFLEVNTRLQVEHPVTEAVTGLDLVAWQLRIAAGEALTLAQDDVAFDGHAIEVRVVAEDPGSGWLPSTGVVDAFEIGEGVRVDTGIRAGAVVSADYDSLLVKVIAHAPTRTEAASRLGRALRTAQITGVHTDVDTLVAILSEADFLAAATSTAYLDDHPGVAAAAGPDGDDALALLLGAAFAVEQRDRAGNRVTGFAPSGWRNLRVQGQRQRWLSGGEEHQVEYVLDGDRAAVLVGPWPEPAEDGSLPADDRRRVEVRLLRRRPDVQVIEVDGRRRVVAVRLDGDQAHTRSAAGARTFTRPPRFAEHDTEVGGAGPVSPLPGTVIAVHVEAGQHVDEGQLLVVVEAMKMEHRITAPTAATVTEVCFPEGERVDAGELLVVLQGDEAAGEAGAAN